MVGAIYSPIVCQRHDWFREYTWTKTRENEFKDWLVSLIRKELKVAKWVAEREADWFVNQYGWEVAEE